MPWRGKLVHRRPDNQLVLTEPGLREATRVAETHASPSVRRGPGRSARVPYNAKTQRFAGLPKRAREDSNL